MSEKALTTRPASDLTPGDLDAAFARYNAAAARFLTTRKSERTQATCRRGLADLDLNGDPARLVIREGRGASSG
jgi:hypothetical protein